MLVVFAGFAVLMFIVVKYVVPMFEKTFAERAEAIEGGIAKAEKAQAEASAALEEYKQQLTDARTEANRIREEARAEGAQILAELKEKAAAESARITAQAHAQIESERQAAVVSLRAEVGTLATDAGGPHRRRGPERRRTVGPRGGPLPGRSGEPERRCS